MAQAKECMFSSAVNSCSKTLICIKDCSLSIAKHLKNIHQSTQSTITTEAELLLARNGIYGKWKVKDLSEYYVCDYHRKKRGVHFVAKKGCQHPSHHEKDRTGKKDEKRSITVEMSKRIFELWGILRPFGEGMGYIIPSIINDLLTI